MESDKIKTDQYIVNIVKDCTKREFSVTINATTTMCELKEIVADQVYEGLDPQLYPMIIVRQHGKHGKTVIGAPPSKLDPKFHYHTLDCCHNSNCNGCHKVNPLAPELENLIQQEKRERIWLEAMSKYEADASVIVSSCEGFQWKSESCHCVLSHDHCEYNLGVHVIRHWTEYSLTCKKAPPSPTPAATTKQCIIF